MYIFQDCTYFRIVHVIAESGLNTVYQMYNSTTHKLAGTVQRYFINGPGNNWIRFCAGIPRLKPERYPLNWYNMQQLAVRCQSKNLSWKCSMSCRDSYRPAKPIQLELMCSLCISSLWLIGISRSSHHDKLIFTVGYFRVVIFKNYLFGVTRLIV